MFATATQMPNNRLQFDLTFHRLVLPLTSVTHSPAAFVALASVMPVKNALTLRLRKENTLPWQRPQCVG